MAGPRITLLFAAPLTAAARAQVFAYLKGRAGLIENEYFWINERPFFMNLDAPEPAELAEYAPAAALPFAPRDGLFFAAICDTKTDHLLLGEVAHSLAVEHGGWIDYHGRLALPEYRLAGELIATRLAGETIHLSDASFLRNYMKSDVFRLNK